MIVFFNVDRLQILKILILQKHFIVVVLNGSCLVNWLASMPFVVY